MEPVPPLDTLLVESLTTRTQTPFLNRKKELVELAIHNAHFVNFTKKNSGADNWRDVSFVYAAQMYGAGKSRIGRDFVEQTSILLKDNDAYAYHEYCPHHLKSELPELLPILEQFSGARSYRYDLNLAESFEEVVSQCQRIVVDRNQKQLFANFLFEKCVSADSPIFFHFDEVGRLGVDDLRRLRDSCWLCLQALDYQQLQRCFPFFFFSGRDAAYDQLGSAGSPVGSHWLILEPLERTHVISLLKKSTWVDSNKSVFQFYNDLTKEELNRLVDFVIKWTAGAPRPLLYTTHMLQMFHGSHGEHFKCEEGLKVIFKMLVDFVRKSQCAHELGPVSTRRGGLTLKEREVYEYFTLHDWLKTPVERNFILPKMLGVEASIFLRSFNVFAKSRKDGLIDLVVPSLFQLFWKKISRR